MKDLDRAIEKAQRRDIEPEVMEMALQARAQDMREIAVAKRSEE